MTPAGDALSRRSTGRALLAVLIVGYAVFLLHFRPADPFEWDEVLFMRAAERYDVAHFSPHAPGYPAFVGAVKLAHTLVADPQLANQLTVIVAALGLLAALATLVRRLGGGVAEAVAAVAALGVTPAFAFNANVGLSDVPGAALGIAAVLALVVAWDDPRWTWLASAVAALAAGVRPQVVAALVPLGVAVMVRLVIRRRWGAVTGAAASGILVSAACWAPAILGTGVREYFEAVDLLRTYVRVEELGYRLPRAPFGEVAAFWLGRPFGATEAAATIWVLAAAGAWWWWRAGRRRMVLVAGGAAVSYLMLGAFSMNFTTAVRYAIPALPFVAVLVAGNLRAPARTLRLALAVILALWCAAQLIWGWRVYDLRRTSAPVWGSLEWVVEQFEASGTTVVYHGLFAPHAEWVLGRAGFDIKVARPGVVYDSSLRPGGDVVVVFARPVPATEVVHRQVWRSGRLERLTRARYYACTVAHAAPAAGSAFSTDFQVREKDWELWDIGAVRLGSGGEPVALVVEPLDGPVYVGGAEQRGRKVEVGERGEIALLPGRPGEVIVRTPPQRHVHLAPMRTEPLAAAPAVVSPTFLLPGLAHSSAGGEGSWRSDLLLVNPQPTPLRLVASLLTDSYSGRGNATIEFELQPGSVLLHDVLAHPAWEVPRLEGALLVRATTPGNGSATGSFFAASRTFDGAAGHEGQLRSRWARGVPVADGLAAGQSGRLRELANGGEWRERSGALSLCGEPTTVRFEFKGPGGRRLGGESVEVPAFAQRLVPAPGEGRDVEALVTVTDAPPGCLVFPFAVMAHLPTGTLSLLVADPGPKRTPIVRVPQLPAASGDR